MIEIVDANAARKQLSKLLDRVRAGEEIIIAVDGKPYARLVPPENVSGSDTTRRALP